MALAVIRPLNDTASFMTESERWEAVRRRNPAADGHFYYSVRTTGVYCRPSCASRPARRENIAFHDSRAAAEAAGFRPCKRCRPNAPPLAARRAAVVAKACRTIESAEATPDLAALARAAGLSRFHFHRVFKATIGLTPRGYAAACRARRLHAELPRAGSVTEAIYGAGFGSSGRFYAVSETLLGMRPRAFRAGGVGAAIRFAVGQCSLGAVLVAATAKGVCAIMLGDDPDRLVRELQDRFPKAQLVGGNAAFERLVARVVGLVETPGAAAELPFDLRGTAFQQRVWQALRAIPPGDTASYAEIARRIGRPHAVRAVAQACAANPVAVAIPCHRVVRQDGGLGGYRWGIARKRALLERETKLRDTAR
ncbi:MAG: bifunctional DNA-binding transcriptional regulator/O6-methylguanine-DNA methyltransferase Ada [Alphaproteobacteria bacterium]|nr:bifunctional DNA-binding transcriptional regulator/O6-methylguanine-DNA methyltransferase Ada [Alphaproteobacteria bacterium]